MSSLTAEQREARSKGLGSSDVAAALGISKWKTPLQLWQEKTGRVTEDDIAHKEVVQWGILLEDIVADEWARRNKVKAHRVNAPQVDKEHDFMIANPDRRIVGVREGLEVKTTAAWMAHEWGEDGSDEVPLFYLTQGVHCMRVMDYDAWNFAVLIGGNELRSYRIERDDEMIANLVDLEKRFWTHVVNDTPPDVVNVADVVRLHPRATGTRTASPAIMEQVAKYQTASMAVKAAETEKEAAKFEIVKYLGDASELIDADDPTITIATFRETKPSTYTVNKKAGRGFRVK